MIWGAFAMLGIATAVLALFALLRGEARKLGMMLVALVFGHRFLVPPPWEGGEWDLDEDEKWLRDQCPVVGCYCAKIERANLDEDHTESARCG